MPYKDIEKSRAHAREYARTRDKNLVAAYHKDWNSSNKTKVNLANKKWRDNNPVKIQKIKTSLKARMMATKSNAIKAGREWDLHFENFKNRPKVCFYTGFKLTLKPRCMNTLSFDRVDNNKGYVDDNVVFCCDMVNTMKSNLNMACFKAICKAISEKS